jgi:hypothetical protein
MLNNLLAVRETKGRYSGQLTERLKLGKNSFEKREDDAALALIALVRLGPLL